MKVPGEGYPRLLAGATNVFRATEGAAARDGGAISVANDRRTVHGNKERRSELKERELGLDCAGWNMTLGFWAAVKVGSGIMAFPCNFDRKAPFFS